MMEASTMLSLTQFAGQFQSLFKVLRTPADAGIDKTSWANYLIHETSANEHTGSAMMCHLRFPFK